jgi:two-component system, chemotaxis family, protein-glutamate methylesterase/glutaminase
MMVAGQCIPGGAMTPFSVLLVDDQPQVLHLLTTLIETDDRLVVAGTASNGQAALATVQRGCPDAIVSNVRMPIMDGLQALPLLRRACPRSVIVVYSSDVDDAREAMDAGADAVFDKAQDASLMLDRLVELCAGGR